MSQTKQKCHCQGLFTGKNLTHSKLECGRLKDTCRNEWCSNLGSKIHDDHMCDKCVKKNGYQKCLIPYCQKKTVNSICDDCESLTTSLVKSYPVRSQKKARIHLEYMVQNGYRLSTLQRVKLGGKLILMFEKKPKTKKPKRSSIF